MIFKTKSLYFLVTVHIQILVLSCNDDENNIINYKLTKIWGPGLKPERITLPARYFFVQLINNNNESITNSLGSILNVNIAGINFKGKPCRVWTNVLDRKDGSYIVRYKLYESCENLVISVIIENNHVAESPYKIHTIVNSDDCDCPNNTLENLIQQWQCELPEQLEKDLKLFKDIDWNKIRKKMIAQYDKPNAISLCHYIVKNNKVYRKCYGKYVGFNMFMDSMLLSLTRKAKVPDIEFFVNLGDWPLVTEDVLEKYPVFSWCSSTDSLDIVMPTYDISESSLENMGRVMLDMLSVQGNVKNIWEERIPKVFWRGRDANRHRLDLIDISRKHPDLFNVSLTNFFFFRSEEEIYGPKTEHVSFYSFFDYKYQLNIDGTVAAYRLPYLLGGGSLIFKQDSKYYEHFYNDLIPNTHYIPVKRDLSDLVEKIKFAIQNDDEVKQIAKNGQKFANENLLPTDIICYYSHLLNEFKKRITSNVEVLEGMQNVPQIQSKSECNCKMILRDEL